MGNINIVDEILAPKGSIIFEFAGKNPFVVVNMASGLLKDVMKITGKDVHEIDVRWDTTSDPREFYGIWKGKRTDDAWTKSYITIIIQGKYDLKNNSGAVRVELKGTVETGYDYSNFFQRGFWWMYNRSFYYKQRRNYIEFAKDNIYEIRAKMMDALGILHGEYA